jgi:hypothetical protein
MVQTSKNVTYVARVGGLAKAKEILHYHKEYFKNFGFFDNKYKIFVKEKNIDLIKSRRDEIITQIARLSPEVTLTALDSMFRRLTAQMMLNLTHENCADLIQKFIAEISLGPDQAQKIIRHIPLKTPFGEFYQKYVKAIQSLNEGNAEDKSDEGLLRFLLNYYNIQVDAMAAQLSKVSN